VVPPAEGLVGAGRIVINYQVVSATATTSSNLNYYYFRLLYVRRRGKKTYYYYLTGVSITDILVLLNPLHNLVLVDYWTPTRMD
jgi:hypothetical protein